MSAHVVSRCTWEHTLSLSDGAVDVQNLLSRWSRDSLPAVVGQCLDAICPSSLRWRVDRIELDLGSIDQDELLIELPRRIAKALRAELSERWQTREPDSMPGERPADPAVRDEELVAEFLVTGMMPWWHTSSARATDVWDRFRRLSRVRATVLLRELGGLTQVRRRFVSQFGESRTRDAVSLLEPSYSTLICEWVDQWLMAHRSGEFPTGRHEDFRRETWHLLLTHLLLERRSLFSLQRLARDICAGLAERYNVAFSVLLLRMSEAASTRSPAVFLATLRATQAGSVGALGPGEHTWEGGARYWGELRRVIEAGEGWLDDGEGRHSLHEVMQLLKAQSPTRLSALLRDAIGDAVVRRALIQHLGDEGWRTLVEVLAPNDDGFVRRLTHGAERAGLPTHWRAEMIRDAALSYLASRRDGNFRRDRFVHHMAAQLGRTAGTPYAQAIDLLRYGATHELPAADRGALIEIAQRLRTRHLTRQSMEASWHTSTRAALLARYLAMDGNEDDGRRRTVLLRSLLDQPLSTLGMGVPGTSNAVRWPGDASVARRLALLAAPTQLPQLLHWLAPDDADLCVQLHEVLHASAQAGCLPSLGADGALGVSAAIVGALPALRRMNDGADEAFDAMGFWSRVRAGVVGADERLAASFADDCAAIVKQLESRDTDLLVRCLSQCQEASITATADDGWRAMSFDALCDCLSFGLGRYPADVVLAMAGRFWHMLAGDDGETCRRRLRRRADRRVLVRRLAANLPCSVLDSIDSVPWLSMAGSADAWIQRWLDVLSVADGGHGSSAAQRSVVVEIMWQMALGVDVHSGNVRNGPYGYGLEVCRRLSISLAACADAMLDSASRDNTAAWTALAADLSALATMGSEEGRRSKYTKPTRRDAVKQDMYGRYLAHEDIEHILLHLLRTGRMPDGWGGEPWSLARLLYDLALFRPAWRQMLAPCIDHSGAWFRLLAAMPVTVLVAAAVRSGTLGQLDATLVERWHAGLRQAAWTNTERAILAGLLHETLMRAWLADSAGKMTVPALAEAFLWALHDAQVALLKRFLQALAEATMPLPPALREHLLAAAQRVGGSGGAATPKPGKPDLAQRAQRLLDRFNSRSTAPVLVHNAGLVLLQAYLAALFERLGLVTDGNFASDQARQVAVNCLQFLATGSEQAPEHYLLLNKLLCGWPLAEPLDDAPLLSPDDQETCEGMLVAVIGHWDGIEGTSIDGLRGNWLVRNGTLSEAPDRWHLIVERQSWDILLSRFPLSYSVIKLPWMEKPVYVTWPI